MWRSGPPAAAKWHVILLCVMRETRYGASHKCVPLDCGLLLENWLCLIDFGTIDGMEILHGRKWGAE